MLMLMAASTRRVHRVPNGDGHMDEEKDRPSVGQASATARTRACTRTQAQGERDARRESERQSERQRDRERESERETQNVITCRQCGHR